MDHKQAFKRLRGDLEAAQKRRSTASERFDRLIGEIPSGVPDPNRSNQIHQASREYRQAHKEVLDAFVRLNNYLIHGTVPPDLTDKR
jgi:hypothetical protein